jgi:hypothetical protein
MKNVFDVTKHQLAQEVNFLVKMVIDKNYSRDMIRQEIENRFNPISPAEKESIFFEVLQKSYINAWLLGETILHSRSKRDIEELAIGKEKMTENEVKDSYVIKLTDFLTGIINSNSFMVSRGNRLGEDFFSYCLHRSLNTEVFTEIDDIELFTIYLKQFAIILRNSDLFSKTNGIARIVSNTAHYKDIYLSLFYSFWIKVKWQDIFPSIPDVARELKRNKGVVVDLILNAGNEFSIADISKVIIELIGLGDSNNLILVSFLDFYFFTWMEHFAILRFTSGKGEELVNASITAHGKRFLKHLQALKND